MTLRVRRAVLGVAASAILAAASLAVPGPARAAPPGPMVTITAGGSAGGVSGCTSTGAPALQTATIPVSGGAAEVSASGPVDVQRTGGGVVANGSVAAAASATLTSLGNEMRSLVFSSRGAAQAFRASDAACDDGPTYVTSETSLSAFFTTSVAGWLIVTAQHSFVGSVDLEVSPGYYLPGSDTTQYVETHSVVNGAHSDRIFVPAATTYGVYVAASGSGYALGFPDAAAQPTDDSSDVLATFTPAGSAVGGAGGGASYLALPDQLDCASHTATAGVTPKAGRRKATKVVVTVNGTRVLSLRPKSAGPVAFAVPAAGEVRVAATIHTKKIAKSVKKAGKGGKASRRKAHSTVRVATVERSYAPCA